MLLFIVPEILFIVCLLIECKKREILKRDAIILSVVSQLIIVLYLCLYIFINKNILYVISSSVAVICTYIAYTDIKEKMISVHYCIGIMLVGIVFSILRNDIAVYNPVITGVAFFLISKLIKKICKNQMGDGDIYLITGYSVAYGYPLIIKVLFSSLLLGLVVGVIGVLFKKITMKTELPFAPFMLVGGMLFELL